MEVQKGWILKSLYQRLNSRFRLPAMQRGELFAAITQLVCKCLWSGWKWQNGYKETASSFACCPENRKYSWKKEKKDREKKQQKSKLCFTTWQEQTIGVCGWRASCIFHDGGAYYTENSPLACFANQWTGFSTTKTSVMKKLMLYFLHVFSKIYSLIMTK